MKLPENCSFAVAPTDEFGLPEFGLLLNKPSNCCRSSLVGTQEPLCRSRATEDEGDPMLQIGQGTRVLAK